MKPRLEAAGAPGAPLGRRFRAHFLTGLVVLAPIAVSLWVTWFLVTSVGNILGRVFHEIPALSGLPRQVASLLGFVAILVLIYGVGVFTSGYLGKWAVDLGERVFLRVPLIKTLYASAKELVTNLFSERTAFRRVVFIEFPRRGIYALAFVTGEPRWTIAGESTGTGVNLFVPTSPNPTSGYFTVVPEEDLIETGLSVEWALRIIISGGTVVPEERLIDARRVRGAAAPADGWPGPAS